MAEPGSASSDATLPADSGSSAAGNPDWEMLSLSMSASAVGKSDVGYEPDKPNPQIDSSFSQVGLSSEEESRNSGFNDAAFGSDAWVGSQHAAVNRDGSGDVVAEPFTEGWKPHLSTPSDLYGYGAERGYVEQNRSEEAVLSHQDIEKYYDSNASMAVPTESFVSKKGAGGLSRARADDVEYDHVSPRPRCKVGKRPRRSRVMWSIAVAATMVGIAVLGHRWRLACRDNQQLRLELSAKDEKLNDLLYQVNRLKDIVGGYHKVPLTRNSGF